METNKYKITFNNYYGLYPKPCGDYFLVQLSDSMCAKDSIVPEHKQEYFEITYAYSGSGISYKNNNKEYISKNDIYFSFPGELHKIESDNNEPLHFICLAFYAKKNTDGELLLNKIKEACINGERKFNVEQIKHTMVNCIKEIRGEDEFSTRLIGFYLEQILVECYRAITKNKSNKSIEIEIPSKSLLAYDIMFYINDNIMTIKHLSDLEKIFYYKIQYLSRSFTNLTGISINKYFISKKMETASNLLKSGKSVTQVSDMLNYSSVHAFSRAYSKYFESSPSKNKDN